MRDLPDQGSIRLVQGTFGSALLLLLILPLLAQAALPAQETTGAGSPALLAVYILLALLVSFLCSIAEAVLLSITPSYIEGLRERHPSGAELLRQLKTEKVDQSLAAILTLNTIAHTVGAIGAGAEAVKVFGNAWFGLFSAVMTLLILFLSEIVPKTIGAVYWSHLALPTAWFVRFWILLLRPVVWISEKLTQFISRGKVTHVLSRDELVAMARLGADSGALHSSESTMIHNLLHFDALRLNDIMTPRTVICAMPEGARVEDVLDRLARTPFSRLPLFGEGLDDIKGFLLKEDALLAGAHNRAGQKLRELRRDLLTVPETLPPTELFERFLRERRHLALVVNEHGGTEGLISLEDLIETLMGMEIVDETDKVEDMRALAKRQWQERGRQLGLDV